MWTLVWTETFLRTSRKFLKKHPNLQGEFEEVLKQLEKDPQAHRLRLHKLSGKHAGKYAVSLTYSYRIVLTLKITEKEIYLLDVGSHDEAYR
ncbi:MAG: type II toxin-antitoxin system mRNA interferase toxin, RelE/StbE family [Deltaproteobacteria bacterium]|nr:type II toxin-antitoxin system mRNA interferase toxin, RelE/StbE family [Deltaproteobacteria bacterium]